MTTQAAAERPVSEAQLSRLADWSMRRPVIALMGEFSAGKSTLMNLLIGQNILPTQVTATRMPPVWLRYGDAPAYRVDHDGRQHPVDLSDQAAIPVRDTAYIRLHCKADILQRCDLMDTPGISDPNIRADDWMRTVRYANAVMWCTHAGQAWRESERGTWDGLPKRLRETSILLVTRKDKITNERDLKKIARRLERETEGLFNARMFVSLTNAIRAREAGHAEAWTESGAQEFSDMLDQIVEGVAMQRSYLLARCVTGSAGTAPMAVAEVAPAQDDCILGFVEVEAPAADIAAPAAPEPQPEPEIVASESEPVTYRARGSEVGLSGYRLSVPAWETEAQRMDLSSYRLPDISERADLSAEDTAPAPEQPAHAAPSLAEQPAETEADAIRDIWDALSQQYDLSRTPRLTAAFQQVLEDIEPQADFRQAS